ncbi:hypothetical protein Tco_0857936 [Tanacetum coccineum]|uniref:Uncharacterized protein n=1 Tax=Tanacetum coccineum TaxID=301880 RepID=A0ABQ5B9G8_9ASTR
MIGTRPLLHIKTQDKRALKIKDQGHKRDLNDHPLGEDSYWVFFVMDSFMKLGYGYAVFAEVNMAYCQTMVLNSFKSWDTAYWLSELVEFLELFVYASKHVLFTNFR